MYVRTCLQGSACTCRVCVCVFREVHAHVWPDRRGADGRGRRAHARARRRLHQHRGAHDAQQQRAEPEGDQSGRRPAQREDQTLPAQDRRLQRNRSVSVINT